jgi:hypothetical protein
MIKRIFATVFLLFLLSCTSNQQLQQLNQLPSWYVNPKPSDQNLYGVGEGYTLAESSQSALNNLAGKLLISISSESSVLLESNKYSTNEQSRQNISESVAKITFNNYQISNSAAFGGKIYTEISVNRDGFIADYGHKLQDLNKRMANIYANLQGKTILEKYNDLKNINDLSIEARNIAMILSGLKSNNFDFKNNIDLYNSYQNSYQNLINKMEFVIEAKDVPEAVKIAFIKFLNKQNFKVVKNKNPNNSDLIIVKINSEITEQKIYGSNIAKLKINFNLLSNQNKIIKSGTIETSGSSVISKSEAINTAVLGIADFNLF